LQRTQDQVHTLLSQTSLSAVTSPASRPASFISVDQESACSGSGETTAATTGGINRNPLDLIIMSDRNHDSEDDVLQLSTTTAGGDGGGSVVSTTMIRGQNDQSTQCPSDSLNVVNTKQNDGGAAILSCADDDDEESDESTAVSPENRQPPSENSTLSPVPQTQSDRPSQTTEEGVTGNEEVAPADAKEDDAEKEEKKDQGEEEEEDEQPASLTVQGGGSLESSSDA